MVEFPGESVWGSGVFSWYMGGGLSWNMYKGETHGQSQRGLGSRVGGGDGWGGWEWKGESGDNCTWTTIKIIFKENKNKKDSIWFITIVPFKFSDVVFARLYFCNNFLHYL